MRSSRIAWVYAALAAYVIGFALFSPRVLTIVDEERYVSQAVAFAHGGTSIEGSGIIVPPRTERMISDYPPGTSLLQTPFVLMFGWRGAMLLSVLSLVAATLLTAAWLRGAGREPAFALLVPAFPGALLFGRVGMSDMPSAALVALVCWLLWRRPSRMSAFAAGLASGLSLLLREPVAVLLAPILAGAMLRRRANVAALMAGGVIGIGTRLLLSQLFFGDAWYVRDSGLGFSFGSLAHTIPVYGLILLLLFPGGALLPVFYRGERRADVVMAFMSYTALFLLYDYDLTGLQGTAKGIAIATRFLLPALPLLVWMAADVWPRVLRRLSERGREIVARVTPLAAAAVVVAAFAIHPFARRQEREMVAVVRAIMSHTPDNGVLITNAAATLKYLSGVYAPRRLILRDAVDPDSVMPASSGPMSVVLLHRRDSEFFRTDAAENEKFLTALRRSCEMRQTLEQDFGWAVLQIVEVQRCG